VGGLEFSRLGEFLVDLLEVNKRTSSKKWEAILKQVRMLGYGPFKAFEMSVPKGDVYSPTGEGCVFTNAI
jgi:hypothetical protein